MDENKPSLQVIRGKGQKVVINDDEAHAKCVLNIFESAVAKVEGNEAQSDAFWSEAMRYRRYYTPAKLQLVK